jgi:hypothetical protein
MELPSFNFNPASIDLLNGFDIGAAANRLQALTEAHTAYLFSLSLCTFFHHEPSAVLCVVGSKDLQGEYSILNNELHISQIDDAYIGPTCKNALALFESGTETDFPFANQLDAKRCFLMASKWSCPPNLSLPGVERLHYTLDTTPFPVSYHQSRVRLRERLSGDNLSYLFGLFTPTFLRPWSHQQSEHSPIVGIVSDLVRHLTSNQGQEGGSGFILNRHSITPILKYLQLAYGRHLPPQHSFKQLPALIESSLLKTHHALSDDSATKHNRPAL